MVKLAVDRVGDLRGVSLYVMGYGRELSRARVSTEQLRREMTYAHVVEEELVVACHLGDC